VKTGAQKLGLLVFIYILIKSLKVNNRIKGGNLVTLAGSEQRVLPHSADAKAFQGQGRIAGKSARWPLA
jgi:hypothetical protein